jgi:hypothetical protein
MIFMPSLILGITILVDLMSRGGRSRAVDRASMKGKWQSIFDNARSVISASSSRTAKPDAANLFALLETAASLPLPDQSPGGE